jgi:D-lactate dehydrogenase (cytochrome)
VLPFLTDPSVVARYLEDAAHYPGGHATAVARPSSFAEVAQAVASAPRVLAVGAQSSLTGGATPAGDLVVSTERLDCIRLDGNRVTAGAGVTLDALQQHLATRGLWLPPVPTFLGATAGGAASTNAAGAATFKYGTTRDWVEGLTVVLADGSTLFLKRGDFVASPSGWFQFASGPVPDLPADSHAGQRRVPVPAIQMPDVAKCSAGYFSAPGMDLVDLFVGSEGTLGVIADVTFRVQARPAGVCWVLIPMRDEEQGITLVDALRQRSAHGLDVAAIEHIDARTLQIMREDGVDRRLNVNVPPDTALVLIVQLELVDESDDVPLSTLSELLDLFGALDGTEVVMPGNPSRRDALMQFRESAPASVNRRVALAQAQVDKRIHKTAADSIVPFERFGEMMRMCRRLFAERNVDLAVWGHISDGNVHPNVVPRSYRDIEEGKAIMLELGREVIAMGGSPLAEHGVGRSPMKQELLRMLYGDDGIESMRAVKRALDPNWKLARGVLFAPSAPPAP